MSYTTIAPVAVSFETKHNNITKPYIRKSFLSSLILNKDDIRHGYIEVYNKQYALYLTEELLNKINSNKATRLTTIASFQEHTNDACVVLCKAYSKTNIRNQAFKKAECKRSLLAIFK